MRQGSAPRSGIAAIYRGETDFDEGGHPRPATLRRSNSKHIESTSGIFSASGKAKLFNQGIHAEFAVDIVNGVIGVLLKVAGAVNDITGNAPNASLVGAVVGTAILPGVGAAWRGSG